MSYLLKTGNILIIVLLFHLLAGFAVAAEPKAGSPQDQNYEPPFPQISQGPVFPPLPEELRNEWRRGYFESPEVWYFRNQDEYNGLIDGSGLDDASKAQLKADFRTYTTKQEMIRATDWLPMPDTVGGLLFVPAEIRKKMSNEFLNKVYTHQSETIGLEPYKVERGTKEALLDELRSEGRALSKNEAEEIERNLLLLHGKWVFPIVPGTWDLLTTERKDEFIDSLITGSANDGIDPFITIGPKDDIEAIGSFFAGERRPRPVIRYLEYLRKRQPTGELTVPLAKILHPFIRKTVGTYSPCHGPNCGDAARNVSLGNRFFPEYIFDNAELEKDLATRLQLAEPGDRCRPGDVLLYYNMAGTLIHAAVVVTDEVVFTKNGNHKTSPYLFQERELMEYHFFGEQKFQMRVLRGRDPAVIKAVQRSRPLRRCPFPNLSSARE